LKNDREDEEIRVTDRRRIYLDDEGAPAPSAAADVPNLKPSYVEELEARTKAAEAKSQEVQQRFEQVRADLQRETDATRQRLNRTADERAEREKAKFIESLLPVLDNLQRAREAADTTHSLEDISEGVRRTADSFEKALRSAGVEPIEAVGEEFNPELHDAVETTDAGPEQDGKVITEYTRGYRIGDRLLRPARVKVGRPAAKSDSASQ
jgi:molecular chaperone GrpE